MAEFEQGAANCLHTTVEIRGCTLLIHLKEDLDHHNAIYIRELADDCMRRHTIQDVVFDFSNVEFMDSSGIGVIMGRYKQVSYVGGSVRVAGIGKNVERIFRMSGLYKLVRKFDTVEEALQ
ncbi:MAG: anti-sigma factor antagonist [Lachnospiraceae bacterium]